MSGPTQFMAPKTDEYAGDEVSALVLDPGYATTRAGFAGEDVPKSVIPTCYGVIESPNTRPHYLLGENSIRNPTPGLEIRNPISSEGIVEDWDMAARVWEYSITERLIGRKPTNPAQNGLNDPANGGDVDVDMEGVEDAEKPLADSPLLMSEPAWNTTKAREKCTEIAMEDWGAPAFYLARTGVLAAFSAGKATALVIDIGASTTSVTPVSDGMVLRKSIAKSPLAGNFVSQQIRLMFSQSQPVVPLIPHYMVASKSPIDAGAPSQAIYKQFKVPMTASFQRLEEERVLTEFKESVVQVYEAGRLSGGSGSGITNEDMMRNHPGRPFEMPDGWNQVFGVERFKVVEGLFDAKAALSDAQNPPPREEHTLPNTIAAALQTIQEPDLKAQLLNHVVVVGGSSLLVGLTRRLNYELEQMFPGPRVRVFAPGNTVERKYASWIGGSILASLGSFHQMWVSKKEYNEHGPNIIEKRCK